jgi:type IV pilus assembly protein PilY1
MNWKTGFYGLAALVAGFALVANAAAATKADYCYDNPALGESPKPNIILLLDSSGSMGWTAYRKDSSGTPCKNGDYWDNCSLGTYDPNTEYYGYAQNDYWYTETGSGSNTEFTPQNDCRTTNSGTSTTCDHEPASVDGDAVDYPDQVTASTGDTWYSGNYINWAVMARIDVGREALIGGAGTSRQWSGGGNGSLSTYITEDGVKIDKTSEQPSNPKGVIQDVADKARWGVAIFGKNADGSDLVVPISKTNMTDTYSRIQGGNSGWTASGNTPLAEALWSVSGYFAQTDSNSQMPDGISSPGPSYNNDYPVASSSGQSKDPLWYDPPAEYPSCQDNFVLYVSDGAPTADEDTPTELQAYNDNPDTGNTHDNYWNHSDHLEDVTFYGRVNDFRSSTAGLNDVSGQQNFYTYPLYAFGSSSTTEDLLKKSAVTGGFEDLDNDGVPYYDSSDCRLASTSTANFNSGGNCGEWDADLDGIPDNYFSAESGNQVEGALRSAVTSILSRVSSGSTVATISSQTRSGGVLLQAYYQPESTVNGTAGTFNLAWRGHLRTLWTDPKGNIREDKNEDDDLVLDQDRILRFDYDPGAREVKAIYYPDDGSVSGSTAKDSIPDTCEDPQSSGSVDQSPNTVVPPVWETGQRLADREPGTSNGGISSSEREIYFNHGDPTSPGDDALSDFDVTASNQSTMDPYWDTASTGMDAGELMKFIRGMDNPDGNSTDFRQRQAEDTSTSDYGDSTGEEVWKLGAIVTSTPRVLRPGPVSSYNDEGNIGYHEFFTSSDVQDRPPMVFVGANDGMLHAFYAGSVEGVNSGSKTATLNGNGKTPAKEAWSFIPQNALPYLRWYGEMRADCNIPTVDYRVQLIDTATAGSASDTLDGKSDWQTLLVGTMGFGGKAISCGDVDGDGTADTLSSSIFVLDVTDPEDPELLWEASLPDDTLTLTYPAVVRRDSNGGNSHTGEWYVVLGSGPLGPEAKNFVSTPKIYAYNLRDGSLEASIDLTDSNNFKGGNAANGSTAVGELLPLDPDQDNLTDAVYFGTYGGPTANAGNLLRLHLSDTVSNWDLSLAARIGSSTDRPFFAAPGAALDPGDDLWIYGATGRFFSDDDKTTTDNQYFFGYVDKCWGDGDGREDGATYANCSTKSHTVTDDLVQTDSVVVTADPVSFECRCGSSFYETASNGASTSCPDGSELVVKDVEAVEYSGCPTSISTACNANDPSKVRDAIKNEGGWYWEFTGGERVFSQPAVLGGLVNVAGFTPATGLCTPGGSTISHAVDYRTGTAPPQPVFLSSGGTTINSGTATIETGISLGQGVPPVGQSYVGSSGNREGELNTLTQPSTGEIKQLKQQTKQLESGILYRKEQ